MSEGLPVQPERPAQLVGQGRTVALLEKSVAEGRLSHAYLLLGRREDCKALALWLAQALNCDAQAPPCGECSSCTRIVAGLHADVQVIGPGDGKGSERGSSREIGIDRIRALAHDASFQPYEGRHKVFVIAEADRLTTEAANCLLKTLEEPPPRVTLVLIAPNETLLLPTLLSRCQRMPLEWMPAPVIESRLHEEWGASAERARLLGRLCAGSLGWAVSILREEKLLEPRSQGLEMLKRALVEGLEGKFALAAELATRLGRQRELAPGWLDTWLSWWRDLLVIKGGSPDAIVNVDEEALLVEQAQSHSLKEIIAFVDSLQAAKESIDSNVNIRLMLETLMLDLPISKGRKEEKEAVV